ncbi:MAG: DUF58 domain-containing protein [Campylobacterota bacterium]|nr:DUF58 domain-containing protein [Campylobacterota bacterium]
MDKNLKKLLIKTKKSVFTQQVGNNSSKFKGDGYDFVELREYEDGEDIRKIDWVISAKMQKPFIKVFHPQRELRVNIIPILNGSVYFGTQKFKQDIIVEISAILGYSASANGDNYGSYIYNENLILNTKYTKSLLGVDKMCEKIKNYISLNKQCDYKNLATSIFKQIKQKSILFLIGDFFDTSKLNIKLLSKKHEVFIVIVRDRFEENPTQLGDVNLTDSSSGKVFDGEFSGSLIKNYQKIVKQNDHSFYTDLKQSGIEFTKIYTDENPIIKLMKLFR